MKKGEYKILDAMCAIEAGARTAGKMFGRLILVTGLALLAIVMFGPEPAPRELTEAQAQCQHIRGRGFDLAEAACIDEAERVIEIGRLLDK